MLREGGREGEKSLAKDGKNDLAAMNYELCLSNILIIYSIFYF